MSDADTEEVEVCDGCGREIVDESTAFGLPDAGWLCAKCAVERGGVMDADGDWETPPRIDDLVSAD